MIDMKGKVAVILGVANKRSIAYAIAEKLAAAGATLVLGYQTERLKREVHIPIIAVGLITAPEQAEAILVEGQADAVALARAILYDPHWPWHAAVALGAQVSGPPQYARSAPQGVKHLFKS